MCRLQSRSFLCVHCVRTRGPAPRGGPAPKGEREGKRKKGEKEGKEKRKRKKEKGKERKRKKKKKTKEKKTLGKIMNTIFFRLLKRAECGAP